MKFIIEFALNGIVKNLSLPLDKSEAGCNEELITGPVAQLNRAQTF
jgi:hypothetical protein